MGDRTKRWFLDLLKGGIEKIAVETLHVGTSDVEEANVKEAKIGQATVGDASIESVSADSPVLQGAEPGSELPLTLGEWQSTGAGTSHILIEAAAQTDGAESGRISVEVDELGGESPDYNVNVTEAPVMFPESTPIHGEVSLILAPDAQVRVVNNSDPTGSNKITTTRKVDL